MQANVLELTSEVSEMLKSNPSVHRFITACAVFGLAACLGACSTQSQLVGTWSDRSKASNEWGSAWGYRLAFSSDNTCQVEEGINQDTCKYAVLDDGRINIEFKHGGTVTGKLEAGKLVLQYTKPIVLQKW
jgi:hypothetical protein